MRTIRNPRYAPEFLERKLSPSAYVGHLTTVLVSHPSNGQTVSHPGKPQAPRPMVDTPIETPNDPMPQLPSGPVGPA